LAAVNEPIRTIFLDSSAQSVELREDLSIDASFGALLDLYGGGQTQPSTTEDAASTALESALKEAGGDDTF
jgi:hypothetical protein